jgi:Tfp pilus assembly protein PilW
MVTARRGHSLAELLVAGIVLTLGLGAAGAMTLAGSRLVSEAAARQDAGRVADDLTDSLLRLPAPPTAGHRVGTNRAIMAWEIEPEDSLPLSRVRLVVSRDDGSLLLERQAIWAPPLPERAP